MANSDRLATQIHDRCRSGDVFCSVEFSPPKRQEDLHKLLESAARLDHTCRPLFRSVTCHWSRSNVHEAPAVRLARSLGNEQRTMLHLAAASLTMADVKSILDQAKLAGIRSVFALRGDERNAEMEQTYFHFAVDLVKFIRDNYGDYFTVCVAGYPLKHPEAQSYASDLVCLKHKVEAGADLIITQITFEAASFVRFVKDCRRIGIQVPILPGIMAIQSFNSLQRMANLCQFSIPNDMLEALEPIKHDDQAVTDYGIHRIVGMMKELFELKTSPGFHISTLNREDIPIRICQGLGIFYQAPSRSLAWKSHEETKPTEKYLMNNLHTQEQ